jgi:hypothetical protein
MEARAVKGFREAQRLEGSRFGVYLSTLAAFPLIASPAEPCENKRLPGTIHRVAALWFGCKRIESVG